MQGKRHIKTELWVRLNVLRLFHVGHVAQSRRSKLSHAWHEWFSCKGKEWKIYYRGLVLSSELQKWKFHFFLFQTVTGKIAPKSGPHVQHDYLSLFNQSNHWFVALSLSLPLGSSRSTTRLRRRRHKICIFNCQKKRSCTPFTCFFISVHFFLVLGKSATWNDHFSSFTENVNTQAQIWIFFSSVDNAL